MINRYRNVKINCDHVENYMKATSTTKSEYNSAYELTFIDFNLIEIVDSVFVTNDRFITQKFCDNNFSQ